MSYATQFRTALEGFLARSRFKPTEFGRQAIGDPSFVLNVRRGRSPTLLTADRVMAFIEEIEAAESKRKARAGGE